MLYRFDAPGADPELAAAEALALQEFAEYANMVHKPIYEGAINRPTRAQLAYRYVATQHFEASFKAIQATFEKERTPGEARVQQIALIYAPAEEDSETGKRFVIKIARPAQAVSVPLYLARVKDVKRVAGSAPGDKQQRLVSWEYFTPVGRTTKTFGGIPVFGDILAGKNESWQLDTKNPQPDQEFHRSELVAVWETKARYDRLIFPTEQYQHAKAVLNGQIEAQTQLAARQSARDRNDPNAGESTDEDGASD